MLFKRKNKKFTKVLKSSKSESHTKNWDETMINILSDIERHSKCSAKKVACLIVNESNMGYNILSIGVNGTPSGYINCCDKWKRLGDGWFDREKMKVCNDKNAHYEWSIKNEIHAEMNALAKCNQNNISAQNSIAFISYSPCANCSKMLVAFGVKRVVFVNKYDDFDSSVKEFLLNNNVELKQLYKDINGEFVHKNIK